MSDEQKLFAAGIARAAAIRLGDDDVAFQAVSASGEVLTVYASGRVEGFDARFIFNRIPVIAALGTLQDGHSTRTTVDASSGGGEQVVAP